MYIPISGYAPDAEPSTPGVLLDTEMMIPTLNGVAALPADADAGVAATPSAVASMVTLRDLAGNNLILRAVRPRSRNWQRPPGLMSPEHRGRVFINSGGKMDVRAI